MKTQLTLSQTLDLLIVIVFSLICLTLSLQNIPKILSVSAQNRRDETRDASIKNIAESINLGRTINDQRQSMQSIFISLPSNKPDCVDYNLPQPPTGWSYKCTSPSSYRKADGSGWLPFHTNLKELPIDPINNEHHFIAAMIGDGAASNKNKSRNSSQILLFAPREGQASSRLQPCSRAYIYQGSNHLMNEYCGLAEYISSSLLDEERFIKSPVTGIRYYAGDNTPLTSDKATAPLDLGARDFYKTKSFSVIFRIKTSNIPDKKLILSKGNPGYAAFNFSISQINESLLFSIKQSKASDAFVTGGKLQKNQLHKVAAVYDDNDQSMRLYLDDVLVGFSSNDKHIDISYNPPILIGRQNDGFIGAIDDFQFYTKPLTKEQLFRL